VSRACVWFLAATLCAAAACKPELDDHTALVEQPRVLAVRALPAEAAGGGEVALEALVALPLGAAAPTLSWALCATRKPLTEQGAVAPACLLPSGTAVTALGQGDAKSPTSSATLPRDVCRLFGPDTPAPRPGEPAGRPVDPDVTGGYYQPARVLLGGNGEGEYASFEVRLACGVSGANQEQSAEFTRRYRANENPALESVSVFRAGAWSTLGDEPLEVSAGERVPLRASWAACPASPPCDEACGPVPTATTCGACEAAGCSGAEAYVLLDPASRQIVVRREALRVAWFATAGAFDADRTGRGGDDLEPSSDDAWTAPTTAGDVALWIIVRDERGGVGWASRRLRVR
jgi:hypothetical protein